MPRPKLHALFELGGQWIDRAHGTTNLYRYWTDAGTCRTRRQSLGTADLEVAKRRLAELVVRGAPKTADALLSAVMLTYFEERTDRLPSKKQSRNAGRILIRCWGKMIRAGEVTEAKQKEFARWCIDRGFSLAYVARNLTVLRAAFAHCALMPPQKIVCTESKMRERWGLAGPAPRRRFIPTDDELARVFRAKMPADLRRWMIVCLLTACRPSAALDLAPGARRRDARLIELNPEGRAQNKKHRPTVREPRCLAAALNRWERDGLDAHGGTYCGYTTIEGVKTALERLRKNDAVNLPVLTPYSFRHKAATVLRAAGVTEDDLAWQLGHKRPHLRVTQGYGEFAPTYLRDAARALDRWFLRLNRLVKLQATCKTVSEQTKKAA